MFSGTNKYSLEEKRELAKVVKKFKLQAERYVLGVSHSWLVYQTCILMEDYLLRGFELGLYADYELQYIHWYLAEAILPCAVR